MYAASPVNLIIYDLIILNILGEKQKLEVMEVVCKSVLKHGNCGRTVLVVQRRNVGLFEDRTDNTVYYVRIRKHIGKRS